MTRELLLISLADASGQRAADPYRQQAWEAVPL